MQYGQSVPCQKLLSIIRTCAALKDLRSLTNIWRHSTCILCSRILKQSNLNEHTEEEHLNLYLSRLNEFVVLNRPFLWLCGHIRTHSCLAISGNNLTFKRSEDENIALMIVLPFSRRKSFNHNAIQAMRMNSVHGDDSYNAISMYVSNNSRKDITHKV